MKDRFRRCIRLATLLGIASATPGCLTSHMWQTYDPAWTESATTTKVTRLDARGMLFFKPAFYAYEDPSIVWSYELGSEAPALEKYLTPADEASGCLETVLSSPRLTVLDAILATGTVTEDGGIRQRTVIEIEYAAKTGRFGKVVSPTSLPRACTDRMQWLEPNSQAPRNRWLLNLEQMLGRWVGLPDDCQLEAWTITDRSFEPLDGSHPVDLLLEGGPRTLFVARFRAPGGKAIGILPGHLAYLLVHSDIVDSGRGIYRSASVWHRIPATNRDDEHIGLVLGPIEERIQHVDLSRFDAIRLDGGFFSRLLATPLTLACDLAFGPGTLRLWRALTGDRPQPDPQIRRGGFR